MRRSFRAPDQSDGGGIFALALLLWAVFVTAYVAGPSPLGDGRLPGPDDYMRLVQVLDWLGGAGWFDVGQARLGPPGGVAMHWSRLADLPLAAVIVVADLFTGRATAVLVAAAVVPSLLLLAILFAVRWSALPLLGRDGGGFAALMVLLNLPLLIHLLPGRVDHHAWQFLFAVLILGSLIRLITAPEDHRPALVAAAVMGLGLWTGPGVTPWVALFSALLCVSWIFRGGGSIDAGVKHAALLLIACVVLLPVARPAEAWFERACDGYSVTYVGIAGTALVVWCALWLLAGHARSPVEKLAATALAGGVGLASLVLFFPECVKPPAADMDPVLAQAWLDNVGGVRSAFEAVKGSPKGMFFWFTGAALGFLIAAGHILRGRGANALAWMVVLVFIAAALGLAGWRGRFLPFAHLFAALPLGWLLKALWSAAERWPAAARVAGRVGLIAVVGPLSWSVLLIPAGGAAGGNGREKPAIAENCGLEAMAGDLSRAAPVVVEGASTGPGTIAAFIDMGPELLYRTPYRVLAAPYHRNGAANLAVLQFFWAEDDGRARRLAAERNIDWVLVCASARALHVYRGGRQAPLVDRLVAGTPPAWLVPVALSAGTDLRLYRVKGL